MKAMKITPKKVTALQVIREVFAFLILLGGIMLSAVVSASLTLRYLASNNLIPWSIAPPVNDVVLMLVGATVLIFFAILLLKKGKI